MKHHTLRTILALAVTLPASAKLAAWYPLDESPSSAATVTENVAENPATMIGFDPDPEISFIERGHPSASQALGTSYLFTKGGVLNLGANAAVQPTDQFTISFFYQPSTFDAFDRILESLDGNDNSQHGLRIDSGTGGNRLRVLVRAANAAANTNFTHPLVLKNDGTWYYCAFRYDTALGDGSAFKLTVLELDGTPVDEAAITAATNSPNVLNTGTLTSPHALVTLIGSQAIDASGGNNLNAALDELAFYDNSDSNGVLTDAQLADGANFGPSGVELITSFSSDKATASAASPATFSWSITEPYDTLTLDDGNGNTTDLAPLTSAGAGTTMVSPSETTTYYLKGTRGDVENVHTVKIISGAAPEITTFSASAPIVPIGGNVDLTWTILGADTLTLDPGATDVSALTTINQTVSETTTFTLSATNSFGTATADVTVIASNAPIPSHSYIAAIGDNTTTSWTDQIAGKNLNIGNLLLDTPLTTASANTNLTATYLSQGGVFGGSAGAFQSPDSTFEIWFRPELIDANHNVIFETGGGQNGLAVLINEDGLRFIGSAANARTLDLLVPLTGFNLTDFVQVTFSTSADNDTFEVSVRDTSGASTTASETANVVMGGNAATLFNWGAGGFGGGENNLGGRTELPDTTPIGLSAFNGEIAILNVYNAILDSTQIDQTFTAVAPDVTPQTGEKNAITNITYDGANQVSLSWKSIPGITYDAEFSTDLVNWFPFEQTIEATETETSSIFGVPGNQQRFFLRIIEVSP